MNRNHQRRDAFFRPGLTRSQHLTKGFGLIVLLGAIGLIGILGRLGGSRASGSQTVDDARPNLVQVSSVRLESDYTRTQEFVGRVEAARSSDLGFELAGLVTHVYVDAGDEVQEGDRLAALDRQRLEARQAEIVAQRNQAQALLDEFISGPRIERIAAARAELAAAAARVKRLTASAARLAETHRRGVASSQDYDEARFAEQAAQAEEAAAIARLEELLKGTRKEQIEAQRAAVSRFEAELNSVETDLNKLELRAPFSGSVADRFVDEGAVLEAGRPVLRLLETADLELNVGVSSEMVSTISEGDTYEVEVRDQTYSAVVLAILPDRSDRTRTVNVRLKLQDETRTVRDGDLATLSLTQLVTEEGFWVPVDALTEGARGLWTCFVATPSIGNEGAEPDTYLVTRQGVELLHLQEDRAFVRGTLINGDLLIISGVQRLVPGMDVLIAQETEYK